MQGKDTRAESTFGPDASRPDDERDPIEELMMLVEDDGEPLAANADERPRRQAVASSPDLDEILLAVRSASASRLPAIMRRVGEGLMALRGVRSGARDAWGADRIPAEHWRALADEAFGLIGDAARRELNEQRLLASMPERERRSFQRICDSRRGLDLFRKAFEQGREAWERAYWSRAVDESFGKRPWTGP